MTPRRDPRPRRRPRPARLLLAVAAVLGLVAGCTSDSEGDKDAPSALSGYTRQPVPSVEGLSLPRADGSGDLQMAAGPGGLRVMYFGFTSCPDVCPTTMSDLKRALATLSKSDRDRVEVAMVTVDPTRDTAEMMTEYVTTFVPDGVALRTEDPSALSKVGNAFGATYNVATGKDGKPEVTHSGDLYAVDDQGAVVLQWPFGTAAKDIGADLAALLAGARTTTTTAGT